MLNKTQKQNLVASHKKVLFKDQERFYVNYRASIDADMILGLSEKEATEIANMAVAENQEKIKARYDSVRDECREIAKAVMGSLAKL